MGIEEEREGVRERECVREVSFEWESYSPIRELRAGEVADLQ